MERIFNITGSCNPQQHYMVNLDSRLVEIKKMIDRGDYFTINRGRQYGKTTILRALTNYLSDDYIVLSMDFQFMDSSDYETPKTFVRGFARELWRQKLIRNHMNSDIQAQIKQLKQVGSEYTLGDLFAVLSDWNDESEKPIVLIIDEVDSASNNQVFLDFLAQLRGYYLDRQKSPTFQSVILAGVHDIRHLKQKIRPNEEHKLNSPWNIAAEFKVDMSFSVNDIAGMLADYENDHHTGMDTEEISKLIYDYTSGYPVLVSQICKINDEDLSESLRWNNEGIVQAVGEILSKRQPLFDSLIQKLEDNESLKNCVYEILMNGGKYSYNPDNASVDTAMMYGFVKVQNGSLQIANRIFETRLYNYFLMSNSMQSTEIFKVGTADKSQFIQNGQLDMEKVLEKFVQHFHDIYGNETEKFLEEDGRKLFLLYLRPIINGTGNYYIEAQTRDMKRTDVVVDYLGKQYVIELKIWRGDEYNSRGEQQIADYLDYFHINMGYMVSFNFNKKKETGIKTLQIGEKILVEAVV